MLVFILRSGDIAMAITSVAVFKPSEPPIDPNLTGQVLVSK